MPAGMLWRIAICLVVGPLLAATGASAQDNYPDRPIKMIVATAAGGNLDITARMFAQRMSEILGQPIVVENRTGASGSVPMQMIARAPADGYTIGAVASAISIVPNVLRSAGFDPTKDFQGIGLMSSVPMVLIVGNPMPAKSIGELIALAKAKPDEMTYASGGFGSTTHLPGALLELRTGIKVRHIPYRGGNAPAYPDVITGRVAFIVDPINTAAEMVKGGQMRALAVTTKSRTPGLPDVPTLDETVAPGFDISLWTGLVVPAGTPKAIVDKIHDAYLKTCATPEIAREVTKGGAQLIPSEKPDQFTSFITSEAERFGQIVKDAGIPVE